jgi:hypothetical protein
MICGVLGVRGWMGLLLYVGRVMPHKMIGCVGCGKGETGVDGAAIAKGGCCEGVYETGGPASMIGRAGARKDGWSWLRMTLTEGAAMT